MLVAVVIGERLCVFLPGFVSSAGRALRFSLGLRVLRLSRGQHCGELLARQILSKTVDARIASRNFRRPTRVERGKAREFMLESRFLFLQSGQRILRSL